MKRHERTWKYNERKWMQNERTWMQHERKWMQNEREWMQNERNMRGNECKMKGMKGNENKRWHLLTLDRGCFHTHRKLEKSHFLSTGSSPPEKTIRVKRYRVLIQPHLCKVEGQSVPNGKDSQLPYKHLIGQVILDKNKSALWPETCKESTREYFLIFLYICYI